MGTQTAVRAETKPRIRAVGYPSGRRHRETQWIRTRCQRPAAEDLLARVQPIAVAVVVDPGVQFANRRRRHRDLSCRASDQGRQEFDAILVIRRPRRIVPVGIHARLPVRFGIDVRAQDDVAADRVAGGQERPVQSSQAPIVVAVGHAAVTAQHDFAVGLHHQRIGSLARLAKRNHRRAVGAERRVQRTIGQKPRCRERGGAARGNDPPVGIQGNL